MKAYIFLNAPSLISPNLNFVCVFTTYPLFHSCVFFFHALVLMRGMISVKTRVNEIRLWPTRVEIRALPEVGVFW